MFDAGAPRRALRGPLARSALWVTCRLLDQALQDRGEPNVRIETDPMAGVTGQHWPPRERYHAPLGPVRTLAEYVLLRTRRTVAR